MPKPVHPSTAAALAGLTFEHLEARAPDLAAESRRFAEQAVHMANHPDASGPDITRALHAMREAKDLFIGVIARAKTGSDDVAIGNRLVASLAPDRDKPGAA